MGATTDYLENWQAQVDEIQALESIFEQDFKITATKGVSSEASTIVHSNDDDMAEATPPSWNAEALAALENPLNTSSWTIFCQISVHIAPPPQEENSEKDAWHFAILPSINEQHQDSVSLPPPPTHRIKYLPPVILSITLPETYPSSTPPTFSLAAMWLSRRQAAEIENELLKFWEVSMPVLWTWADWIQNSLMEYLVQLNSERIPGYSSSEIRYYILETAERDTRDGDSSGNTSGGDNINVERDQNEEITVATTIPALNLEEQGLEDRLIALLHYSAAREMQIFHENMHTCLICFEDQRGSEFLRLDCRHVFCTRCVLEQSNIHIREGTLDALKCPEPGCNEPLAAHTLRQILEKEVFDRWETLTLQRALDQMSDAAYCPRCGTLSLEDLSDNCADCPKCFYVFCTLCNEGRHPGVQCVSVETRLAMLRRKAEGGGSAAVAELRKKEHEMMSLATIEKSTKPCPACGMAIQRSEGCNKMVCGNCNAFFCYKCGKKISGYDHYKAGGSCVLFDEAEILRWERRWQEQAGAHAAAAFRNDYLLEFGQDGQQDNDLGLDDAQNINRRAGRGGNGGAGVNRVAPLPMANCPQCGQPNYRFARNNHLQCWSCTRHFCAVCKTVLQRRGGGMHFGPKGCPQHT